LALDDETLRERLSQVFARQDFYEACKRRDAGSMVRILMSHGITQGQLSALTGIAQSTLSNYKRRAADKVVLAVQPVFGESLALSACRAVL
jgi:hypothetical protein